MIKKKFRVSNEELALHWDYRSLRKAVRIRDYLNENMGTPLSIEDEFLVHNLDTGELVR